MLKLIVLMVTFMALHATDVKLWKEQIKNLNVAEKRVLLDKKTERPYSGVLLHNKEAGVYKCKLCDTPLYNAKDKFDSHCGWPSFDDEIKGAIKRKTDKDGRRVEILCANCGGHLGHVFKGEGMTAKNTRHCVNSVSLRFEKKQALQEAYFAGGCFWGVEYHLEKLDGVKDVVSGYMGGRVKNPTYKQVSYERTGHLETVKVLYDPTKISYETLTKAFFEIHDPTQKDGQGPDKGSQYLSAIFYIDAEQKKVAQKLIDILTKKGLKVATKLKEKKVFYDAETYHQDYYEIHHKKPYCHVYTKRF